MASVLSLRVLRKLHSQPKADVLLCVASEATPDELVVVKRIHYTAASPTGVESPVSEIAHEVRMVRKVHSLPPHPHIVRFHSISRGQGEDLITMEHCSRGDLLTWLEQQPHKRFPEPQALAIFRQILSGVRFLHTHGIAHRDISLENCLVTQDYTIKICDFELATSASSLSRQHVGKLNYMAPEVVRGDYYDSVKADVWSLGIVLFMLLTGSTLYEVAHPDDVVFAGVRSIGINGALRQWGLDGVVSDETVTLMENMLRVDVESRIRDVQAIEAAIVPSA